MSEEHTHRHTHEPWDLSRGLGDFEDCCSLVVFGAACCARVSRNSPVSIATRYGLNGPGIESPCRRDIPRPSKPALGPTRPPIQRVPGLSRGYSDLKWRWPPILSSAEVKEKVKLHLYSLSGLSWPVIGWILPLPLPLPFLSFMWRQFFGYT